MWIVIAIVLALLMALTSPVGRRLRDRGAALLLRPSSVRFLLIVVTSCAGLRLALLASFTPPDTVDMKEYVEKAEAIVRDGHPRNQEQRPDGSHVYRAMGYPLVLAGWFAATGWTGVTSARVLNVLLSVVTAWLLMIAGDRLRSPAAGRMAAILIALHLPHAIFSVIPYGETLAALLLLGVVVLLDAAGSSLSRRGGVSSAASAGLLLGILVMARPEYLWLPVAVLALAVCRHRRSPGLLLAPVAAGLLALAAPIAVNHAMRAGYPGMLRISVQGGLILYFGNNPLEVNGHGNGTPVTRARLAELSRGDPLRRRATAEALAWMRDNPLAVLANLPRKLYHLWIAKPEGFDWHARTGLPGGLPLGANRVLGAAGWIQWLFLASAGLLGLFGHRDRLALVLLILVTQSALFALLSATPRFHLPFEPLLALGAGLWVVSSRRNLHAET